MSALFDNTFGLTRIRVVGRFMKKRASFSDELIRLITFALGMAFFIIYIAGAVLFYINEDNLRTYTYKVIILFCLFLLMYVISVIFIRNSIIKRFSPLDKLARGLVEDEIIITGQSRDLEAFANQLRDDMKKMQLLSKELNETKETFDDYYQENETKIDDISKELDKNASHYKNILKRAKRINDATNKSDELFRDIEPVESRLKVSRDALSEDKDMLNKSLREAMNLNNDTRLDIGKTKEAYSILLDMLSDTSELLENIYNDIMTIQSTATQFNLYAVNTSIEVSKSGFYNLNILNGMDEMKDMTKKILELHDAVALLLIRARNAIGLAKEQASICDEEALEHSKTLESSINKLDSLKLLLDGTMGQVEDVIENVARFTTKAYEIKNLNDSNDIDSKYILDNTAKQIDRNERIKNNYKQDEK